MALLQFPKLSQPVADRRAEVHPVDALLDRLAPGSRRAFRVSLNGISRFLSDGKVEAENFDWASLRYPDAIRIREFLGQHYSVNAANFGISAFRVVMKESWRLGLIGTNDYQRVIDIARFRGSNEDAGRALSKEELAALFDACLEDPSPAGTRDAAMMAVLYGAGLRRAEMCGLTVWDYRVGELKVNGKGQKLRMAYLSDGLRLLVEGWLSVRGGSGTAMFVAISKGGCLGTSPLDGRSVAVILNKRAKQAGVAHFAAHDLRRTFATHLLENGVDVLTLRNLMGHSSVTTTQSYDKRGEEAKREAASLLVGRKPSHSAAKA